MQAGAPTRSRRPTLTVPSPPLTVQELAGLGTQDGRLELVDGTLVLHPWPTPLHSRVARRLRRDLARAAGPGTRVVERRPVMIGERTLLVPDLAVVVQAPGRDVRREDGEGDGDGGVDGGVGGGVDGGDGSRDDLTSKAVADAIDDAKTVPLLAVEISNPSKRRFDHLKLDLYRECGVASCWLVDPDEAGIEAYDLVDDRYVQTATAKAGLPLDVVRPFPLTIIPASLVDPPNPD